MGADKGSKGELSEEEKEIFFKILDLIEAGDSVRKIFENNPDIGVCRATFKNWIRSNNECLAQYAHATSERADIIFDEMFNIADDGTNDYISIDVGDEVQVQKLNTENIQRSRLRIDTRKWALSKMNPKKYGDKLDLDLSGELKIKSLTLVKASESSGTSQD